MDLTQNDDSSKVKKKEVYRVVAQLPTQEVRTIENDTEIVNFITIEEYLTAQANAGTK